MTTIAWRNGPIMRSGAVGTGQACCCGQSCPQNCYPFPTQTTSWEGIVLPDSCGGPPCVAWSDNDGTYVRVLRTQTGDGLNLPGGFLSVKNGACYLTGYVGTSKISNAYPESEGACRAALIVWEWNLPYGSCDVQNDGPYTLTAEFYSGYNLKWVNGGEQQFAFTSLGDACFEMSQPAVELEFPP